MHSHYKSRLCPLTSNVQGQLTVIETLSMWSLPAELFLLLQAKSRHLSSGCLWRFSGIQVVLGGKKHCLWSSGFILNPSWMPDLLSLLLPVAGVAALLIQLYMISAFAANWLLLPGRVASHLSSTSLPDTI